MISNQDSQSQPSGYTCGVVFRFVCTFFVGSAIEAIVRTKTEHERACLNGSYQFVVVDVSSHFCGSMCVQMTVLYLNQCFVYFHIDAVVIGYRLNQPCIGLLHLYVAVLLKSRLTFTL